MIAALPRLFPFFRDVLFSLKDVDGRPLRENRAPDSAKVGVAFHLRACPYAGCRRGTPMNVSALEQMTANWDEVLADIAFMRRAYMEHWAIESWTLFDLWRFATLVTLVPAYGALRADHPVATGQLPARVAADFKVMLGTASAAMWLMRQRRLPPETPLVIEQFLGYLEEEKLLVNSTTSFLPVSSSELEACAGPPHMFRQVFRTVLWGDSSDRNFDASRAAVGNVGRWLGFGRAMIRMILGWPFFQVGNLAALRQAAAIPLEPALKNLLQQVHATCEIDIPSGKMRPGASIDPEQEHPLFYQLMKLELGVMPPAGEGTDLNEEVSRVARMLANARPGAAGLTDLASILVAQCKRERDTIAIFEDAQQALCTNLRDAQPKVIDSRVLDDKYPWTLRKATASWAGLELSVDRGSFLVEQTNSQVLARASQ